MSDYLTAWMVYCVAVVLGGLVLASWLPKNMYWRTTIVFCGLLLMIPTRVIENDSEWVGPALWIGIFDSILQQNEPARALYSLLRFGGIILSIFILVFLSRFFLTKKKMKLRLKATKMKNIT